MARKDVTDLQVCRAYVEAQAVRHALCPYDFLMEWTDQPFKVCWRAIERAADRGLIQWGVSLRTGWLTEKGLALLAEQSEEVK